MKGAWADARRILVMRLDNIGDVVMTSPVLRALKENLPEAHITLMASPGGSKAAPLLPWADETLPWRVLWQDLGRLSFDPAREWELIETLREGAYDAAIILTSFNYAEAIVKGIEDEGLLVQISPRGTVVDYLYMPTDFLHNWNHLIPIPQSLY